MFRKKSQRPTPLESSAPSAPVLPVFPSPTTTAFAISGVELDLTPAVEGKAQTGATSFHKPSEFRSPSPPSSAKQLPRSPSYPGYCSPPHPPRASNTFSNDSHTSFAHSIASLYPSPTTLTPPTLPKSASLPNVRRTAKASPTFNLIVVGAKRTGKTSFIETLLGNVQLARGHGEAEAKARVARFGGTGATREMQEIGVEVMERGEKIGLTVIDTPGLKTPLTSGRLGDELEVERQLATIMRTVEARFDETLKAENQVFHRSHRAHDSHLHLAIYFLHPESLQRSSPLRDPASHSDFSHPPTNGSAKVDHEDEIGISETDLRCIKRLSQRVNVLPVIARSDELTLSRLAALKAAIKRDLAALHIPFFTFFTSPSTLAEDNIDEVEEEDRLQPVRVIRTQSTSRSGKRGIRNSVVVEEEESEDDEEEKVDYEALLPFALVAPENPGGGRFVREFRYGTVDVLNPEHSDFTPMRNALLGTQMKLLKESTRLDKYEPFRTHRLLARRATQAMPDEERAALISDLLKI